MYEWVYINSSNSNCIGFAPVCSCRAASCSSPLLPARPQAVFLCLWICSLMFFRSGCLQNIWESLLSVTCASLWKSTFLLGLLLSQSPKTGYPGVLGPSGFFCFCFFPEPKPLYVLYGSWECSLVSLTQVYLNFFLFYLVIEAEEFMSLFASPVKTDPSLLAGSFLYLAQSSPWGQARAFSPSSRAFSVSNLERLHTRHLPKASSSYTNILLQIYTWGPCANPANLLGVKLIP